MPENYKDLINYYEKMEKQVIRCEGTELHTLTSFDGTKRTLDVINGCWLNWGYKPTQEGGLLTPVWEKSKAGLKKYNMRSYVSFPLPNNPAYMLVDYVAMLLVGMDQPIWKYSLMAANWHDLTIMNRNPVIHHKDNNTENSKYENLHLTSNRGNNLHSTVCYLMAIHRPVFTEPLRNGSCKLLIKILPEEIEQFNMYNPSHKIYPMKYLDRIKKPEASLIKLIDWVEARRSS